MTAEPSTAVLIAEDSEDSRFLLRSYCAGSPYQPTFADDGEKAVDAYKTGSFKIVVMDIRMPIMDGLQATRLIRHIETDQHARRTPILALTANGLPADIVLALEAGCDLHLAKPISKKGFLRALDQWRPAQLTARTPPSFNIPAGMEQRALSYLLARQLELPLIQDLCRRLAFHKVKRLAQNLKASGTSYGLPEITRLGANIERAALGRDIDTLRTDIAALATYLDVAVRQVRELC